MELFKEHSYARKMGLIQMSISFEAIILNLGSIDNYDTIKYSLDNMGFRWTNMNQRLVLETPDNDSLHPIKPSDLNPFLTRYSKEDWKEESMVPFLVLSSDGLMFDLIRKNLKNIRQSELDAMCSFEMFQQVLVHDYPHLRIRQSKTLRLIDPRIKIPQKG